MPKVKGADRLERKLKAIPKALKSEIRAALIASAEEVVAAQRRLAPKKTGKLAKSIVYVMGDRNLPAYASVKGGGRGRGDPETTAIMSAGNSGVRYAHLVEFGTAPHVNGGKFAGSANPGTPARPFFFPGFRLTRKRAKSRIARAVGKAARKAAG